MPLSDEQELDMYAKIREIHTWKEIIDKRGCERAMKDIRIVEERTIKDIKTVEVNLEKNTREHIVAKGFIKAFTVTSTIGASVMAYFKFKG